MADKDDRLRATVEHALRNKPPDPESREPSLTKPDVYNVARHAFHRARHAWSATIPAEVDAESTLWEPLIEQLEYWAYNYLRRRDCLPGAETIRLARALAAEAAMTLMHAEVPYHTDFEPWMQILVQDVVRRRLRWH